jgi:hypothetical protein
MNKNSTFLYGALAVIVILVFLLVLYFLGRENSQSATINDKVTGFYGAAPINNRCSVQPITEPTTLLPTFDLPQNCEENYTCVQTGINGNPFGYCKVPLSSQDFLQPIYNCNTVYDCAPATNPNEIVYCNGTCQVTTLSIWNSSNPKTYGGLYSYCDFNTPCDNGLVCNNVLNNFTTSYGECLIDFDNNGLCNDGSSFGCCTANEQCIYGFCDFNRGSNSYGMCISRIEPSFQCDTDFCETGFGCDTSQIDPSEHLCQPLLGPNSPAQYGKEGSFCKIGTVSGSNDFMACNAGLICNFELSINGINNTSYPVSNYPSLVGIGQCVLNKVSLGNTCNTGIGCEEPLVCNNGICSIPGYLFSNVSASQTPDVNYCGPEKTSPIINYPINGSSGACLNGYTCIDTNMSIFSESDFCVAVPESSTAIGLCNSLSSGNYGNFCGTTGGGVGCNGRYIGVFLQGYSYLGVWRFVELPDQTVTINKVNANSKISIYQSVDTSGNSNYPITKIIFYPNNGLDNGNIFFYYTEFSTYYIDPNGADNLKFNPFNSSGNQPYSINWKQITVTAANGNSLPAPIYKYINNSVEETIASSGYTNSIGNYTHLELQIVGGGGAGGGAFDATLGNSGGGGGGSGKMLGYLGSLISSGVSITQKIDPTGIPVIATYDFTYGLPGNRPVKEIYNLPINFNVKVTLGAGGIGGFGQSPGPSGGNTIVEIIDTSTATTVATISVDGGNGGERGGNSDSGDGGEGFNGGGGGASAYDFATPGNGGIGDISNGGANGQIGVKNEGSGINQAGNGGGTSPFQPGPGGNGGTLSSSNASAGGGGGSGSGVYISSSSISPTPTTGGRGTYEDAGPSDGGTNAIDYTGGGGGGSSYIDSNTRPSTDGGKGYAILYFYSKSDDYKLNTLYDIKFSSAGNIAMFVNETAPLNDPLQPNDNTNGASGSSGSYNRTYLLDFSTLNITDGILEYTVSDYGPLWTSDDVTAFPGPGYLPLANINNLTINKTASYYNSDTFIWDIDDLYNNSIVIGFVNGTDVEFWSASIPTSSNKLQDLSVLTNKTTISQVITSSMTYPNYVKYFTDFKNAPSDLNFMYNYNNSVDILEVNNSSTSSPYIVNLGIALSPAVTYAINFSRYGTLNNFIFYYMSDNGEIRTSKVTKDKTGTIIENESNVYGYAPVEVVNYDTNKCQMLGLTSTGNIDNSLYALVETCN